MLSDLIVVLNRKHMNVQSEYLLLITPSTDKPREIN